jgi:cytochrome P450
LVTAATVHEREYSPIDITSHDFWSQPFAVRDETFAQLRAGEGLTWHRPFPSMFPMEEPGYWALTRRADIAYVSQHSELFTSAQGVALDPMPAEIQHFASFFLTMEPPQHPTYRRLSSSAFTPRNVRQIEEQIHSSAVSIVDDLVGAGDIDFVEACSARLPMLTIMKMLDVPSADRPAVAKAAEKLFGMSDDDGSPSGPAASISAVSNSICLPERSRWVRTQRSTSTSAQATASVNRSPTTCSRCRTTARC